MKLYLVTEDGQPLWVAALWREKLYGYVPNTGKFHDNNALRNDFYMQRDLAYTEIGSAEASRLIENEITPLDEAGYADALARWRADPKPLNPAEVLCHGSRLQPLTSYPALLTHPWVVFGRRVEAECPRPLFARPLTGSRATSVKYPASDTKGR